MTAAMKFGIGQPVRRKEDIQFVTGQGRYTDDIVLDREVHAVFVRSPHAHARILNIDTQAASAAPEIIGVIAQHDIPETGSMASMLRIAYWKGELQPTPKTLLAAGKVRYCGDPVVMVVAQTVAQAKDAAELVAVEYEPLSPVSTLEAATRGVGDPIWDHAPGNLAFDWSTGDKANCEAVFATAAHVVSVDVIQNQILAASIEPRAALGEYDPGTDTYTLHTPSQTAGGVRERVAGDMLKIPVEKLRVITPDVGGGFGMKAQSYPEHGLVLVAAKKFGRPVKWNSDRTEGFLSDSHARDARTHAELALDADGRILAVRVIGAANIGAYFARVGAQVPTAAGLQLLGGLYRVPVGYANVKGYFTNNMAVSSYRGAGRPEAAYVMDRLLDQGAAALGIDRIEIRRRNLLRKDEMPYRNWVGLNFNSGDTLTNLETAVRLSDWNGFAARRKTSEANGKKRGIGVCYYVEIAAGPPGIEPSAIKFTANGAVEVYVGSQSCGQGHETAFAQLVSDQLGVPFDSVIVKQGDTASGLVGLGSVGSRSLQTTGNAIGQTGIEVIRKGKIAAGQVLQAGGAAVDFVKHEGVGRFVVSGSERAITTGELAIVLKREILPDFENGLDSEASFSAKPTYPNGCHICEVEIDGDTGATKVARYTVVDDVGRVINPMIVEGQVIGGVAQGLGQVLMEHCIYDTDSGQLLTASFADYAMPRATDMPNIESASNEVLCTTNPLGSKGAGEAGTVGAMPAIVSAICDALGVAHIDMPVTAEKAWRALKAKT